MSSAASSPKASGYSFSLNLVRSLGLWSATSTFPSNVTKPTYITLNPSSGTVDWAEQLRKYTKHNSATGGGTAATAQVNVNIVVAQTRLELAVWQAVERLEASSAFSSAVRRQMRAREGRTSGQQQGDLAPAEWLVKSKQDRFRIEDAAKELRDAFRMAGQDGTQRAASYTLLALAAYTLSDFKTCLDFLRQAQSPVPATPALSVTAKTDTATHDLDLQILAVVLNGLVLEQLAHGRQGIDDAGLQEVMRMYRTLPLDPPPPVPEAQRFTEVGLARLCLLDARTHHSSISTEDAGVSDSVRSPLAAHRYYLALTGSFGTVSPQKKVTMIHSYLTTVLHELSRQAFGTADRPSKLASTDTSDIPSTFHSYEKLLLSHASLSAFPHAGQPTHEVNSYISLLYSFWELGCLPNSQWVVDSLYRALSKTYASQKLHRYLVMVLSTLSFIETDRRKGRLYADDARRNLKHYVALFEKSRETDQIAVQKELTAFRQKTEGAEEGEEESADAEGEEAAVLEKDEDFARVACMGTRLLLVESTKDNKQEQEDDRLELIQDAYALISKAIKVLQAQQSRDGEHKDQVTTQDGNSQAQALPVPPGQANTHRKEVLGINAETYLWHGIAQAEKLLADADTEVARSQARKVLESLAKALEALPDGGSQQGADEPSAENHIASFLRARVLYSMAFAQLEMRDVPAAISMAKRAVDALPPIMEVLSSLSRNDNATKLRIWHLLVVAISAQKDWAKAREVAELALFDQPEEEFDGDADRTFESQANDTTVALADTSLLDVPSGRQFQGGSRLSNLLTPGDAPHDPASTGKPSAKAVENNDNGSSGSSSFVNIKGSPAASLPGTKSANAHKRNVSIDQPAGSAAQSSSGARTRHSSLARPASAAAAGRSLMTHRTTGTWEDLESEIEFWITRNRCIEAVDGPEVALQDLQRNVFTRFSRRREELEAAEAIKDAAAARHGKSQLRTSQTASPTFPYPSEEMQRNSSNLPRKLDHPRSHTVSGAGAGTDSPSRARSIIGSVGLRHRARTNSVKASSSAQDGPAVPPRADSRAESIHSNVSASTSADGSHLLGSATSMHQNHVRINNNAAAPSNARMTHPSAARTLSRLWLTSAASFRRWGKLSECLGAISEAEDVAGETDPEVWVQYALYLGYASPEQDLERAILSLQKGIAICTDYVPVVLTIGKIHIDQENWAIAEGFLDVATQTNAWDSPEAWFLLAKVYEGTKRNKRARECFLYALELEQSRPIRDLRTTLKRWV